MSLHEDAFSIPPCGRNSLDVGQGPGNWRERRGFLIHVKAPPPPMAHTPRMNTRVLRCLILVGVLSLLGACRRAVTEDLAAATREYVVTGIVRAPLQDGQIVVEHEEVPGLMPGMTMPFYVANETEAARLAAGDRVRFRFVVGDASRAGDFEILGHEAAADVPMPGASPRVHRLKEGDAIPPVRLIDQNGTAFTESEFVGRLTVVTFIFTRCPVPEFCPATIIKFQALQSAIGSDPELREGARLATVTLDPEFDRSDILKAYGEAFAADFSRWRFLTGDPQTVREFAQAFSVYAKPRNGTLDHSLCTALIDHDGRVSEFWRGNGWQISDVLTALRAHTQQKSDETLADRL